MAAQESGLSPDFIKKTEQNLSSGFLYNLLLGSSYSGTANGASSINGTQMLPLADQVFNAERKVILDLAKKMISLAGKKIDIEYIGLRPGEKLFEELLISEEGLKSTENKKIVSNSRLPILYYCFLSSFFPDFSNVGRIYDE